MRKLSLLCVALLAVLVLAAGCAKDLKLTPGGEKVQVQEQLIDPQNCELLTTMRVSAQSSVRAFGSSQEHAQRDIVITARNLAADKGANVVVPKGEPEDGKQTFEAYRCK